MIAEICSGGPVFGDQNPARWPSFSLSKAIVLSNASDSRIGTTTSRWEHFNQWKKINSEGEQGVISLETLVWGTCEPARFLDIVENFILFTEERGGLRKIVAKNHQHLGVNNAIAAACLTLLR